MRKAPVTDQPSETPPEQPVDRRLILMARTIVVLYRAFETIAREHDITIPQYRFLLTLKRGPKRAGELAVSASIRKPTASALIADMEKRGLIVRQADETDGRSVRLRLTDKGLEKHKAFELALARYLPSLLEKGEAGRMLDAFTELAYIIDSGGAARDSLDLDELVSGE
ncbi:MAG: MarR family transcriptional regulator [Parvibaculaceae bacterium]|nr:MarR family transcriptional regulator [Parvibaculaceae bacterium]